VARDLVAAGAVVPGFVTTSAATAREAVQELQRFAGIEPRAHLDLESLLADEPLDALAILSPPETHAHALRLACEAGLPVLCEKPFVWGGDDPAGETATLLEAFAAKRLAVWENCQWPFTLPAFERLHPGVLGKPPAEFGMELEPITRGAEALVDALSHPLSLLQALAPGAAQLEGLTFEAPSPEALTLRFRYRTSQGATRAQVSLRQNPTPPRHAAYTIDGHRAVRVVAPESYRLSFHDAERAVPLADPLTQLVADFVGALRQPGDPSHPEPRRIHQRMQFLAAIAAAYASEETR
jgi:predicted dehydrogenase